MEIKNPKILVVLLLLLNFSHDFYFAQAPDFLWVKSSVGLKNEISSKFVTNANGEIIVLGTYEDNVALGTTTLLNTYPFAFLDVFLAKYNSFGNVLWSKKITGSGMHYANAITGDAAGNTYVVGCFSDSLVLDSYTLVTQAWSAVFLAKYDASGMVVWVKSTGGPTCDAYPTIMSIDSQGNLYVGGNYTSTNLIMAGTTLTNIYTSSSNPNQALFLAQFDANGDPVWLKGMTGQLLQDLNGIVVDQSDNVFISGDFLSQPFVIGNSTLTPVGSSDIFLAKFDPSGNMLWAKRDGGNSWDWGGTLTSDPSGEIVMVGGFSGPNTSIGGKLLTNFNGTGDDPFIVKYTTNGVGVWAKSIKGSGYDGFSYARADANGRILVAGVTDSPTLTIGTSVYINQGMQDFFICQYEFDGTVLWSKMLGGTKNDFATCISNDNAGNVILYGNFSSPYIDLGSTKANTDNTGSAADIFLAKLVYNSTPPAGLTEQGAGETPFIYPNPTSGEFTIVSAQPVNTKLSVTDLLGKTVLRSAFVGKEIKVDLKDLPQGLYFVRIEDEKATSVIKLMKQ